MGLGNVITEPDVASEPVDILPAWLSAMRRGDFEAAWQQTDRIEIPRREAAANGTFSPRDYHLVWDGSGFAGQRVLVRCEHGLGDTLQFVRYLPRLQALGAEVIVKAQPMLLDLLIGMESIDSLRNGWTTDPDPEHDVEIECMEFPYAFRDTAASVPAQVPYLPTDYIRRATGEIPLPDKKAKMVGIIWAASEWDTSRSFPFELLQSFARVSGIHLVSLQQGSQAELAHLAAFPITCLSERTDKVVCAAAAMLNLDLIITVDSMAAHLGGALGRPVWALLQKEADWRWMNDRADSPWYPTMRLFRQPRQGDWRGLAAQVVEALTEWANVEYRG